MSASTNTKSEGSDKGSYKFDPYEWSARVSFDKDSLGTSFSVCVFVTPPTITGDPFVGKNPVDWIPSKYYAGQVAAFTATSREGLGLYGAPKTNANIIQGFVSLNDKLKEFIDSVEPKDAEKHLRDHLLWKVEKGGKEVDLSKLPTLEVTIFSSKLKGVRDDVPFPEYEDAVAYPGITEGKRGGSKGL